MTPTPPARPRPLRPAPAIDPDAFRRLAHAAVDLVADHLDGIRERPVFAPMTPASARRSSSSPCPTTGSTPETLLDLVGRDVLAHPMGNGHPRFFGWVNSPPAPVGIVADFLAAALDPSCAGGDHAAIYVERAAVRWLMELVGFPAEGSMGLLVSGARRPPSPASPPRATAPPPRTAGTSARAGSGAPPRPGPLPLRGGPQLHPEGGRAPGARRGRGADRPRRRRLPDGRGRAPGGRRPGPRRRAPAVLRGGERGHRQHRRDRPPRRAGRPLPGGGTVAPRRRRVRRDRRRGPGARRPLRRARARGLARARPAQVALGAGRMRVRARPRRAAPAGHVQPRAALPPHRGGQGLRRAPLVLGVRLPADPGLPRAQALDGAPAPRPERRGRARRPPRGPGPAPGRRRRRGARPRAPGSRRAVGRVLPLRPAGLRGDDARLDALNKLLVERVQAEGRVFLTGTVLRGGSRSAPASSTTGRRRRTSTRWSTPCGRRERAWPGAPEGPAGRRQWRGSPTGPRGGA